MSGIPPLPPLRMKEADGSPNVIPVFQVTVSNMTLINNGGGKVTLDGAGGTGPAGPAGTVTIGSGITGGATDGFLLMVSNGATLGQIDSSSFQRAIAFPITTGSGGTGRTTIGSAHTILGVNSSEASLTYYAILASNNAVVTKVGTSIFITATTSDISGKQDSITFPLSVSSGGTGQISHTEAGILLGKGTNAIEALSALNSGELVVGSSTTVNPQILGAGSQGQVLVSDSSKRLGMFWVNSGSLGSSAGGGNGVVNAGSSGNLAYYAQAGTAVDDLLIGSAGTLVGVNSSGASHQYFHIKASDNTTVVVSGTGIFISATTNASAGGGNGVVNAGSSGNLAYYAVAGTAVDDLIIGSALTIIGVNSSAASHEYKTLVAGNNVTITYQTTGITIAATTGGPGTGTVNTGSASYLAFYPSAGTTVDDAPISISTAGGIAPFNVQILTNDAASVASGDFWFQSSSNKMYLAVRSSNTTYLVELGS